MHSLLVIFYIKHVKSLTKSKLSDKTNLLTLRCVVLRSFCLLYKEKKMSKIDKTWRKSAIGQKEGDLPDDNANIIKYIEALQDMIARARHEEDKTNGNLEITIEFEEDAAEETSEQNPPNRFLLPLSHHLS